MLPVIMEEVRFYEDLIIRIHIAALGSRTSCDIDTFLIFKKNIFLGVGVPVLYLKWEKAHIVY